MFAAHHGLVYGVGRENILKVLALNFQGLSTAECGINPTELLDRESLLDAIRTKELPGTRVEDSDLPATNAARAEVNDSVHGSSAIIKSVLFRW